MSKRTAGGRGQTLDSRYTPQLFLAAYPLQAKRRIHYNMGHGYLSTLLQAVCMPRDTSWLQRAGTFLAIIVFHRRNCRTVYSLDLRILKLGAAAAVRK